MNLICKSKYYVRIEYIYNLLEENMNYSATRCNVKSVA